MTNTAAALDLSCPTCHGTGRYTHYSALGNSTTRCPMCKGRKVVTAAQWLRAYSAEPRTLTREEAITRCAHAIGMDPRTGGADYGKYLGDYDTAHNGVAGLVVDLEECGHSTVLARFLAAWRGYACEGHRNELDRVVIEVRAARAIVRAEKRAA